MMVPACAPELGYRVIEFVRALIFGRSQRGCTGSNKNVVQHASVYIRQTEVAAAVTISQ
jgi:hypothetical protein